MERNEIPVDWTLRCLFLGKVWPTTVTGEQLKPGKSRWHHWGVEGDWEHLMQRSRGSSSLLWGEESQCQAGWECRWAGRCERFPTPHMPGRDGWIKCDFPQPHLLDLLLSFSPHTPHPLLFVHRKKKTQLPKFSWFSLSLFVLPKWALFAGEDDNFPWKPVEKEAGFKITSPHTLEAS